MSGGRSLPLIRSVTARQIHDSRGRPTVEADVVLGDGTVGRASVPSGASTGRHEAHELRDRGFSYGGLSVLRAVENVRGEIATCVSRRNVLEQAEIDAALVALDGTKTLERLGGNAILATSLAVSRAAAAWRKVPLHVHLADLAGCAGPTLPLPMANILSGGAHARGGMDLQDFLVVPVGAGSLSDALEMISRVREAAAQLMTGRGMSTLLADEGGLSPGFARVDQALDLMIESFERAHLRPGEEVGIALDVAASEFFVSGRYALAGQGISQSGEEMTLFLAGLVGRYPIVSIEDPLEQDDWANWTAFTSRVRGVQVVGDDLFVTNAERIRRGASEGAANAALIKLNQNGTLSGTLAAVAAARQAGYGTVVSARSGETEDSFIADLAVGTGAGQIKIGSFRNSERLAKYNQLLRIESETNLPFAGRAALSLGADARVGQGVGA
jgi:enolase